LIDRLEPALAESDLDTVERQRRRASRIARRGHALDPRELEPAVHEPVAHDQEAIGDRVTDRDHQTAVQRDHGGQQPGWQPEVLPHRHAGDKDRPAHRDRQHQEGASHPSTFEEYQRISRV
jgi:hypothetical protein